MTERSEPRVERRASSVERAAGAPGVSLVIPTHNRARLLEALLLTVSRLEWPAAELDVWVVGDPEIRDNTREIVERFAGTAPFPVTYLEAPNSPAAKRNAGIRAATGSIIAFTDDDCLVDPGWLSGAFERFADAGVVGVQGQTVVPAAPGNPASTRRTRRLSEPNYQTCNILYRREALDAVGGFDERFRAAISEDSDLAFSVLATGGTIAYAPDAIVHHPPREDRASDVLRAARNNFYAPLLHKKHPTLYRTRIGSPLPRTARLYFGLGTMALLGLCPGAAVLGIAGAAAYVMLLAAQVSRHCRGDRSPRRAAATALSLFIAPYAAYYYLAAGNLQFRGRLWW